MQFFTRIRNIFSKPKSSDSIGIALRQHSIAVFDQTSDENKCISVGMKSAPFAETLQNLVSEYSLQGQCHLVLSNAHSQIVQVEKPKVPETEINSALQWQIKDLVNIAPENMMVDYFDGPTVVGGIEKVNVVCTTRNDLVELVSALNTDNLVVSTITTEEFAFASLLPIEEYAVLLVCQQPNEEINLLIIKEGRLFFSRRLRGLSHIANKSEDELAMGIIDSLSLEIQRSTDYFERQLKQTPIKTIEVLVPITHEAFLARKLAENTNIEVKLFTMPESFENERENAVAIAATKLNFMEPGNNG